MSFDETMDAEEREYRMSQSLSSRAMSFDEATMLGAELNVCLNPFRAGRCLSTMKDCTYEGVIRLNPFRAGRCLSTYQFLINFY